MALEKKEVIKFTFLLSSTSIFIKLLSSSQIMAENLESMKAKYQNILEELKVAESRYHCGDFGYIAEVLAPKARAQELHRELTRQSPHGLELRAREWQRWMPVLGELRNENDSERAKNNLHTIYGETYEMVNRLYNIAMEGVVMATPLFFLLQ